MAAFFDRKLKVWQWLLLMLAIVIAILFFLWKTKKPDTDENQILNITSIEHQEAKINADSIKANRIIDSLKADSKKKLDEISFWKQANTEMEGDYRSLNSFINEQIIAGGYDSTGELRKHLNDLSDINTREVDGCNEAINGLAQLIENKDKQISAHERFETDMRNSLNECLDNQAKLQADNKKKRKRFQIAIGPTVNFYPEAGVGGSVDFIGKKGRTIGTTVLRMNRQWYGQVSYKFTISL